MDPNQRLSTLFSFVMIVATATLGWFTLRDSGLPRVGDSRLVAPTSADEQDVAARLWEDPFQAVQQALAKPPLPPPPGIQEGKHTLAGLQLAIGDELKRRPGNQLALLIVSIPDTPYPDDIETRLRLRYSIQLALADRNYYPANRSYLGYFQLRPADLPNVAAQSTSLVPYEWFLPRLSQSANDSTMSKVSVLVLWLPESRLGREPLSMLSNLSTSLAGQAGDRFSGTFFVGPQSSDTLKAFIAETKTDNTHAGLLPLRRKFAIFSARATAPDAMLDLQPHFRWDQTRRDLARNLQLAIDGSDEGFGEAQTWRYFHNFIATDDQLTDLLVAELELRGIPLHPDEILVLAEADTAYGRSLPVALQASLEAYAAQQRASAHGATFWSSTPARIQTAMAPSLPKSTEARAANNSLRTSRYLRGLDQQKGQTQLEKPAARTTAKTPDEALANAMVRLEAMPLGESQLDYVDRLVREIGANAKERAKIRAVAVLGGDIYDKMILLRSLRPRFPDAVFFTTDLDARLWHPDHLKFTRNLVVASATDIGGVHSDLNPARIPPFRDTYQTTVFHAARAALVAAVRGDAPAPLDPPGIFEIGRHGPRALMSFTSGAHPKGAHMPVLFSVSNGRLIALLAGLLAILIVYIANYRTREVAFSFIQMAAGAAICVIIAFATVAYYQFPTLPGGEPWSLDEGISIWPTEILRLIIIGATTLALIGAWRHHRYFRVVLARRYHLRPALLAVRSEERARSPNQQFSLVRTNLDEGWRRLKKTFRPGRPSPANHKTHDAAELFQKYLRRSSWRPRTARVLTAILVYGFTGFALVFVLHGGMPPNTHIRGAFARGVDLTLLLTSVACFLGFLFAVLDAVFVTKQLLDKIRLRTRWPDALNEEKRREFAVEDQDLDGFLDVSFAAELTADLGRLIYLPFLLQFLFILSRNSYFDHWTWPLGLVCVFCGNFTIACVAWGVLRHSAKSIRRAALDDLASVIHKAAAKAGVSESERARHKALLKMRKRIEEERRGAYSRIIQDPALLAMLLPTSVFGIVVVLSRALFGGF